MSEFPDSARIREEKAAYHARLAEEIVEMLPKERAEARIVLALAGKILELDPPEEPASGS
jgi:hypothetical protein